jgi:serine/threonine protein kinase
VNLQAPEVFTAKRTHAKADIYALGVIMNEAICARPPWGSDTPFQARFPPLGQLTGHGAIPNHGIGLGIIIVARFRRVSITLPTNHIYFEVL